MTELTKWIDELRILGLMIPASMLGTLCRLGLTSLTTYNSPFMSPLLYSQSIGSFILGFTNAIKGSIDLLLLNLSVAITTGYCGSLTTWSAFQMQLWQSYTYIDRSPTYVNTSPKGAAFDVISNIISTTCISTSSVNLGVQLGKRLQDRIRLKKSYQNQRNVSTFISILLGLVSYAIVLALSLHPNTHNLRSWTYSLLFAPAGAYIRYRLSVMFNRPTFYIPWGTLTANNLGTIFTSLGFGLMHLKGSSQSTFVRCDVLRALQDGLGGSTSTVSTMANELVSMNSLGRAWIYSLMSLGFGQAIMIVIAGSMKWSSKGFESLCSVG